MVCGRAYRAVPLWCYNLKSFIIHRPFHIQRRLGVSRLVKCFCFLWPAKEDKYRKFYHSVGPHVSTKTGAQCNHQLATRCKRNIKPRAEKQTRNNLLVKFIFCAVNTRTQRVHACNDTALPARTMYGTTWSSTIQRRRALVMLRDWNGSLVRGNF